MNLNPTSRLRAALLGVGFAAAAFAAPLYAVKPEAGKPLPPQTVLLRVQVSPEGKVTESKSLDPNAMPAIVEAGKQVAAKLTFTPASKDGRPVSSETSLVLTLALVPHDGGGFGVALKRAQNGPSVTSVGRALPPKSPRTNGAVIIVGADLRADGSIDMSTFKVEKAELRVPSEFDQSQYEKAARVSLKDTHFMLDKVDGVEIPAHLSVPYLFNGGADKRKRGHEEDDEATKEEKEAAMHKEKPALAATSNVAGVVLPKIDYKAPETEKPADKK